MFRILHRQSVRWLLLLALVELALLCASLGIATWLRFGNINELEHLPGRSLAFALMLMLGLAALGQYQLHMRTTWFGLLARQAVGFLLGGFGLVVLYYVLPEAYVGRGVLIIALVIGFALVTAFRALFQRLVEVEAFKRRILVLGSGVRAAQIHNRMRRRSDRRGFTVVGFVARPDEPVQVPAELLVTLDLPLHDWVERHGIDEIVVGVDDRRGGLMMDELLECRQLGIDVTDLTTFFERESGRVQLALTHPSWLVYSGGFYSTPMRRFSKRGFDVVVALVVLALMWPFMLLTALAIMLESGWRQPVLYRQERVGVRATRSGCTSSAACAPTPSATASRVGRPRTTTA